MIVIIGGGITGLAAAYELTRRNVPFRLLESSSRAGGLIVTEHVDGFTIDGGPDSILAQKPAALQLCDELGLSSRLIATSPPRTAFVLKSGRLHKLPSPSVLGIPTSAGGLATYDLLPWGARARIAMEPLIPARAVADESVASFFRRRFGPSTVDLIAEPLLGGIHAGDIERLSMPSLFPRLVAAEQRPGRVLRNAAPRGSADSGSVFRALRGGMSELVEALVASMPAGAVRLGCAAAALERAGAAWRVVDESSAHEAQAVILAVPAHVAAMLLQAHDSSAAELCRAVPYVSTASVALAFRRDDISHALNGSGFVVARRHNAVRMTACTWVSSKWASRAPEGYALLRVFLGGAQDPAVVDAGDEELIGSAMADLSPVLGIRAPPLLTRVFRWPSAGAQHNVGHRARMTGLAARLRALPGVFVAGSGFESIGIPDCVAHGRRVASEALDYATIGG